MLLCTTEDMLTNKVFGEDVITCGIKDFISKAVLQSSNLKNGPFYTMEIWWRFSEIYQILFTLKSLEMNSVLFESLFG